MNVRPTVPFTTALAALKQKLFPLNYKPVNGLMVNR